MPVHDWALVDAGTYHDFHNRWITHLVEGLNGGLLPSGFYAMSEQHAGHFIPDMLTLQVPEPPPTGDGGIAVVEAPPRVHRKLTLSTAARGTRRTLTIRHVSGHRIIALVEITSPANKDRAAHVAEFAEKAEVALLQGLNLLLVDLFAPGEHDPQGLHAAVWARFDDEPYHVPPEAPLTLASYVGERRPVAYIEHMAVGSPQIDMPLFLNPDRYINVPLEPTYMAAYRGMPAYWRDVLDGRSPAPSPS